MALSPRLQPGDVSLHSERTAAGRRWVVDRGRCAACGLEVSASDAAVVYRPDTQVESGAPIGLMHWHCATPEARAAPEDAPRVIRFNVPGAP